MTGSEPAHDDQQADHPQINRTRSGVKSTGWVKSATAGVTVWALTFSFPLGGLLVDFSVLQELSKSTLLTCTTHTNYAFAGKFLAHSLNNELTPAKNKHWPPRNGQMHEQTTRMVKTTTLIILL